MHTLVFPSSFNMSYISLHTGTMEQPYSLKKKLFIMVESINIWMHHDLLKQFSIDKLLDCSNLLLLKELLQ